MKKNYTYLLLLILTVLASSFSFGKNESSSNDSNLKTAIANFHYNLNNVNINQNFRVLDLSGFTSSQKGFLNREQTKIHKYGNTEVSNDWLNNHMSSNFKVKKLLDISSDAYLKTSNFSFYNYLTNNLESSYLTFLSLAPTAQCKNIIVQLDASGSVTIADDAVDNGSFGAGTLTFDTDITTFTCANSSTPVTVTLTVIDSSNQPSTCTALVTVEDNIDPTIACPGNISVTNTPGTCGVVVTYSTPVGSDNCTGSITTQTAGLASGSTFPVGTTINTFLVTDGAGNTATCSFNVTVTDLAATATVSIAASTSTTICQGTSVTFTPTPLNGGTYEWFVNNVSQGSSPTFMSSSLTNGAAVRAVMTSNLSACNTTANSNVINMTVNNTKPVSFTINGPNTVCFGQNVTYSPSNNNNFGADVTYQWKVNGVNAVTTRNFSTSALNNGDVISLEVVSSLQCANPVPATSSTNPITVNPLPTLTTSNGAVCASNQTSIDLNSLVTTTNGTPTFYTSLANANAATGAISSTVSPSINTTYYVRSQLPSGCFVTDTIIISINPLPTVNAGADQSICIGSSFDLSTIATGSGTLTYYTSQANANNASNSIGSTVSPSSTTTYYVRSEIVSTGCYATDSVIITVNSLLTPTVAISSNTTSICSTNTITFSATPTNGGTNPSYQWYVNNIPTSTNNPFIASGLTNGANVYVVMTVGSNICVNATTATSASIPVTVYTTPANPGIISGVSGICPVATENYSVPNNPNIQSYNWTVPTGYIINSGNGTNEISVSSTTNATNGSITVTATNLCGTSTASSLPLTVGNFAYVNAGPDQYICLGTTQVRLAGDIDGVITNRNQWEWSASPNIGTLPNTNGNNENDLTGIYGLPSNLVAGQIITVTIRARNTTKNCSGAVSDTMQIFVLPDPTAGISGGTTICSNTGTNITFTGTPNTTVTYKVNGGANQTIAIGASGSATLPTGNLTIQTTYSLESIAYNYTPGCSKPISGSAIVNVNPSANVNAGADQIICSDGSAAVAAILSGSATSGSWASSSGNALGFVNAAVTDTNYTPNATDIANGTVTLTFTSNDPVESCPAGSDSLIVAINPAASVNAGSDQVICSDASASISAILGGSAIPGSWTSSSGNNAGFVNASLTSTVYTPNATDITNGSVTLTFTSTDPDGPCPAGVDSIIITINPAAEVTVGADQIICSNDSASIVANLSGSAAPGSWTSSSGNTAGFGDATLPSTVYSPNDTDIANGSVTLAFTTSDPSGPCNLDSDSLIITIRDEINIDSQPENVGVCEFNPASLSVVASGDDLSYQWYHADGSTVNNTSNISGANTNTLNFALANTADAGGYYVIVSNTFGDCSNVPSITVTLNVNQEIDIDVSDQPVSGTVCAGENFSFTVPATGSITSYQWYKVNSPTNIALTDNAIISGSNTDTLNFSNITTAEAGNYYLVLTGPGGTCPSVSSTNGTLTVTPVPTANISYTGTPYCSDSGTQVVTRTGTNAYTGGTYSSTPAGLSLNTSNGNIITGTSTAGTYTVTYTIPASGGCPSVIATTSVTVTPRPTASISYADATYCETDSTPIPVILTGTNAYTGGSFSYTSTSGTSVLSINSGSGTIDATGSDLDTYTVTYTVVAANGCSQVMAITNITIGPMPVATFTYNNGTTDYCSSGANPLVTYTGGGVAGNFTSAPGLVLNASTGAINLASSAPGSYTITNTISGGTSGCTDVVANFSIYIEESISGGAILLGNANDDDNDPTTNNDTDADSNQIVACHQGNGYLYLPSSINSAHVVKWQYLPEGGTVWQDIGNVGSLSYTFSGLQGITAYRVVLDADPTSIACGPVYSAYAFVSVIPYDLKPQPVSVSENEFCLGETSIFSSTIDFGGDTLNSGGDFESGQLNPNNPDSWLIDGEVRGWTASGNNTKTNQWSGSNGKTFNTIYYDSGDGKFGITSGVDINNQENDPPYYWNNPYDSNPNPVLATSIETPRFSLLSIQNPTFEFDEAYQLFNGGGAIIEISLDGGLTYIQIPDNLINGDDRTSSILLSNGTTSIQSGNYGTFGNGTNHTVIDLSPYFGNTDIRIRLTMIREASSIWAVDNFELPNNNGEGEVQWTDQFDHIINPISGTDTIEVTPVTPGNQTFTVTSFINGCRSIPPDGSVDVQLEVHYANAGYSDIVDPSDCGGSVSLHAYDNSKSPLQNYIDLNNAGIWDNANPLFAIIDDNNDGIWDLATQDDLNRHNPTNNIYTYTNLASSILLTSGSTLDPGNYRDYGTTTTTQFWTIATGPAGFDVALANQNLGNYFSDVNDPQSEFFGPGGTYTLQWNIQGSGTIACSAPVSVTLSSCTTLDFDGIDDNVTFRNNFDLNPNAPNPNPFSIEVWIKPDPTNQLGGANNGIQTILSKRDATTPTSGYDLRLVNNKISFNWNNGNSFTHSNTISTNRWYHVAVTFDGNNAYKMYIDGIELGSGTGAAPINNNFECIMGAMDRAAAGGNTTPVNYFSGWLDELRIWNTELSVQQIRQMMNQEIDANGVNVRGLVVPLDIPGLNWANLDGYYRMNQVTDIVGGYVVANAGTVNGQMRNIETWQDETAPLPYESIRPGNWNVSNSAATPWRFGNSVWDFPNSTGINGAPIDWNIVRTGHNISSGDKDITVLGLLVDAAELSIEDPSTPLTEINDGQMLYVTHYLRIGDPINPNGATSKIDLVGESQLVQKQYGFYNHDGDLETPEISNETNESFFDSSSIGIIERDQQGTGNPFNYNYWGSPVAPGNASVTIDNVSTNTFNLLGVLRAGTVTIPDPLANALIDWTPLNTAVFTSGNAVQLSTRWLYKYSAISNTYANWAYVGNSGAINIGLGYSMKGSGADPGPLPTQFNGTTQNYVFVGKPNNGTITNPIAVNHDVLVGNPYPSAIDANAFINDNAGNITGALYFWEHYFANNTHVLRSYIGGYATYNFGGGLEAATPPPTSDGILIVPGYNGEKKPERYIPVGQGFFVSSASGGTVTFKNSQRIFKREGTTNGNESVFFRTANSMADEDTDARMKRIRLRFNSPEGALRPLLLAFEPNNLATDGVDYGYDALNNDAFPSDLSWMIDGAGYVIQGVGAFDINKQYPFAMKLAINGEIKISLTDLENFDDTIDVYVYDSLLGTYHQIKTTDFTMTLDAGNYDNRFFLTFIDGETLTIDEDEVSNVLVNYLLDTNEIFIKPPAGVQLKQVYLINLIGQTVKSWNMTNMPMSDEIRIPTKNISEGAYIIKVETDGATINKKVIIKYK